MLLTPHSRAGFNVHMLSYVLILFLYLAVLSRSRFGTLGYRVAGVRVVGLSGEAPTLGTMAYRSLFVVMGPLNGLIDLVWVVGDPCRQTLRDKIAGTYIVRRGAKPAGRGRVGRSTLSFLGYSLSVDEVRRGVT